MAIADARIKLDQIHSYTPKYTPSVQQQGLLSKQNLSTTPTELSYVEKISFFEGSK